MFLIFAVKSTFFPKSAKIKCKKNNFYNWTCKKRSHLFGRFAESRKGLLYADNKQKQTLDKKNNSYFQFKFQVIAVNAEGVSEPLECVDAFIPENPFGTPGAPGKPEQIGGDFDNFEVKYEVIFQKKILFIFLYIGF